MLGSLFTAVSIGWFKRRILDVGGWAGAVLFGLLKAYDEMPDALKEPLLRTLSGNWREITLGVLPGAFAYVISQVQSWRATVTPQVVTPAGNKTITAQPEARPRKLRLPGAGDRRANWLDKLTGN
jgi:hypothetical protein